MSNSDAIGHIVNNNVDDLLLSEKTVVETFWSINNNKSPNYSEHWC